MSMNQQKRQFRNIIAEILGEMKEFGDTAECVAFVRKHNGRIEKFYDTIYHAALTAEVSSVMRSRRIGRNIPAFPSIEVETGELDEQGTPITKPKYVSMKQVWLNEDWSKLDKVVDGQCKRARSYQLIANATVEAGRLRGYQRDFPFPDLIDEEEKQG